MAAPGAAVTGGRHRSSAQRAVHYLSTSTPYRPFSTRMDPRPTSPGPAQADGGRRCSPRARPPGAVRAPVLALGAVLVAAATGRARARPRRRRARHRRRGAASWCSRPPRSSPSSTSRCTRPSSPSPRSSRPPRRPPSRPPRRRPRCAVYEPQLRAIAQSGYTGKTQSRVAAFLTSESADELVQQMTTLDMIAAHTNSVVAERRRRAGRRRSRRRRRRTRRPPRPRPASPSSRRSRPRSRSRSPTYEADFARLTAAEQAAVTTAVAGPRLQAPRRRELPARPRQRRRDRRSRPRWPGRRPLRLGRLRPRRLRLLRA